MKERNNKLIWKRAALESEPINYELIRERVRQDK